MKKILLTIALIFCIFQTVVLATAIDIGMLAIDRNGYLGTKTLINKGNPANASGKITNVEIYAVYGDLTDCYVATFYRPDPGGYPNKFTSRDRSYLGIVAEGYSSRAVDLNVQAGDYLGIWIADDGIEDSTTGESGVWSTTGNATNVTDFTFSFTYTDDAISLYGTGETVAAGIKWNGVTITKWNGKVITKWNGLEQRCLFDILQGQILS